MMKKVISATLTALLLLSLIACGAKDPWQEQYDLGLRYLNEGNYQEAVIAFEAAIEIDANRVEAYSGLSNTYMAMGEYDKGLQVWDNIPQEDTSEMFALSKQKSQKIRTAMENGESGIWIMGCSFDKANFTAGKETKFQVTVFYYAAENAEHSLELLASTSTPHSLQNIGKSVSVGQGAGAYCLTGSAVPVQIEGNYFHLLASLHLDGSGPADVIYITPGGTLTDAYAPVNAYGGIEFTYRDEYLPFEEFTAADQQFIAAFASAAIADDTEAARSLLGHKLENQLDGYLITRYTIWNGYKLKIETSGEMTSDDGTSAWAEIQMRSENGTGYVYRVTRVDLTGESDASWNRTVTNSVSVRRATCPCSDWQWNGLMTYLEYDTFHMVWVNSGDTVDTLDSAVVTGNWVNGLRSGVFSLERHYTETWSHWPSSNVDTVSTATATYQDGQCVAMSDEEAWDNLPGGSTYYNVGDFVGASYELCSSLEDEWQRSRFFW